MRRKGFFHLAAFMAVVFIAVALAVAFLIIFKIDVTNEIKYEHKSDGIGLAYITLLNMKHGSYINSENMGSYIFLGNNAPDSVKNFNTNYFSQPSGIIYSIFPGQTCIDYFVRESITLTPISRRACTNLKELSQVSAPVALPYNNGEVTKIVSLVTVK